MRPSIQDLEHVSGVLRSVAGSLALLQYTLEDQTDGCWLGDDAPYKRLGNLIADIGECTAEAVKIADELAPNSKQWLWGHEPDENRDDDDDDDQGDDDPREPNPPQSWEELCEREAAAAV
jgi:hypothetical protein